MHILYYNMCIYYNIIYMHIYMHIYICIYIYLLVDVYIVTHIYWYRCADTHAYVRTIQISSHFVIHINIPCYFVSNLY